MPTFHLKVERGDTNDKFRTDLRLVEMLLQQKEETMKTKGEKNED